MYNLIECSDNYSKSSVSLWQYYRDGPAKNKNKSVEVKDCNIMTDGKFFLINQ